MKYSSAYGISTQCLKCRLARSADFGMITTLALVLRTGQSPKLALDTCIGTEGNLFTSRLVNRLEIILGIDITVTVSNTERNIFLLCGSKVPGL